ncbi:amidohydrolase [Clostridium cochlearium]|uniref:5-methylthioadenosine/S-adenosylhomocysteine deaminase n=1 Tax=Clostridium cochlearium TaxID=1494 RepID=A0A1G9HIF8_CLOCO|nr:amidohydrolase [Clostridium cochlearium]MBE6064736.1 amidohydrolase [Clostridium cochlearium]MBU5268318.1 amidohydrolase [Clostridium cochlearium]MCG4572061.1 amidohydrolase [Clostridium cochlearium]MCR1970835.1 amidohydrolase [Clostridium cochlearium]MDU1442126.1 amidohydrolase [Clostridium cochlearium]
MSILIENIMIVTMDQEQDVIGKGYILIKDNKIKEVNVGEYLGKEENLYKIDGKDHCAMPGLINAHTHAGMTIFRGYGEGLPLMRWLNEKIWPIESKLKNNHVKIATELAALEMLRSGTTCFNDMYFYEEEVIKVAKEFNIRGVIGVSIMGDNWEHQLKEAIDLDKKIKEDKSGLIDSMIAPHSPYTLSIDALKTIAKEAKLKNKNIHIHISETQDEVNIIKERYNKTSCELLQDIGIFNSKVAGAHCVYLTDNDMNILKENGASVIYNPQSNMKLASGIARIAEMNDIDINVCLGTDGTSSNNNLNMIEEMETGTILQKLYYKDATKLNAKQVLKMATYNGAMALMNDKKLGKIKEDYLADIVLLDLNKPNMIPINDIHSNIVFSANGSEVDYVIVNGNIVMEKGEFKHIDEEKVLHNFKEMCNDIFNS